MLFFSKMKNDSQLAEIEIIEVKTDRGRLSRVQKDEYAKLVKNGYPLRLFHVGIVSFDNDNFEVKHKLVRDVNEVEEEVRSLLAR